jgi:transposase
MSRFRLDPTPAQEQVLALHALANGWGPLAQRLEDKAQRRIVRVNPAYTSLRCNACGHVDRRSRESQGLFRCTSCGHSAHADVNAAHNIRDSAATGAAHSDTAAGPAVAAREGGLLGQPMNREPQLSLTS